MVRLIFACFLAALVTFGGSHAVAQEDASLEVLQIDAREGRVDAVVAAPRALIGQEIPASAFEVIEAGERRDVTVERLPNEGLEVVLVIDTSGSMAGEALTAAQGAAVSFVQQMPPGVRIGIVGFGDTAAVVSPFETDPAALISAIEGLEAGGETALYDALAATVSEFRTASGARRSIILLSDGGDTVSRTTLESVVSRLDGIDADFVSIALATEESDTTILEQLASAAAGRNVAADAPDELAAVYETIASRLVNRYQVVWTPRSEGPTQITIGLEHGGVSARAATSVELAALVDAGPPVVPAPPVVSGAGPGLLGGSWTLAVGSASLGVAMLVGAWLLIAGREPSRRLSREVRGEPMTSGLAGRVEETRERAVSVAERFLERRQQTGTLNRSLDQAGLALRPGEFVLVTAGVALLLGAVGITVTGGLLGGIIGAGVTLLAARSGLRIMRDRRRTKFGEQLGDTLQMLSGSLRSGHGLPQAIDAVAREAESPTADEFRRLTLEARLGRDFNEALEGVADRVGDEDFEWVVQAIRIHREVGGDLAEILDTVGETIRDRARLKRQVKSLSAEGRLTAWILLALPFVVLGLVGLVNPGYHQDLTGRTAGQVMTGVAAVLMVSGAVWIRRIVRLEF